MAEVELSNIEKIYGDGVKAVKGIDCVIKDKEFVVFVGPSGCGKTTTLRMIAGLEEISGGDLTIEGKRVNELPASERGIAMVFQNYSLYPHMNAYENMAFGLKIKKVPKSEIKERVLAAAKILNIESLLYKKPGKMSGGQRQRIAIGRAIVRRPKVFLFDEPLSNLDAKLRSKMRIEIARLHKQLDTTMIYVTHDQVEAMTLGQRIVVMKDGHIMQIDEPVKLFNNPKNKFVAEFIGTPQMNMLDGLLKCKENKTEFVINESLVIDVSKLKFDKLESFSKKKISLGIRSEDLRWEKGRLENFATLKGKVVATEILGNQKLVHLDINNKEIIAQFRSEIKANLNDTIDVYLNLDKAYFFEMESGKRLL